mmetsp:Transcript_46593/g.122329  ORF Transcript_46593/g.122329 Transcript_46593/m.122329 type:complete len:223 (+) Transcript_46593:551-1219(+)
MAALRSAFQASILTLSSVSSTSMSTVQRWRENGSVSSERRWREMTARSTECPEGSLTGSSMSDAVIGSRNSSGTSPSSASASASRSFTSMHRLANCSSWWSCSGRSWCSKACFESTRTALRRLFGSKERSSRTMATSKDEKGAKCSTVAMISPRSCTGWKLYLPMSLTFRFAHLGPTSSTRKWFSISAIRGASSGSMNISAISASDERYWTMLRTSLVKTMK